MIYVMRAIAATTAVEAPTIVDGTNAQFAARGSTVCLSICDSFAGVFGDFPSLFERGYSKTSLTFNCGFFDGQAWGQVKFHVVLKNCNANLSRWAEWLNLWTQIVFYKLAVVNHRKLTVCFT